MLGRSTDADIENGLWTQCGKERVKRIERVTDIYTLTCVKQLASGKLLYSTGSSAWCSMTT